MKHSCRDIHATRENTRKLGKFACKTLHADCYNLRVFGLFELLHRWLSECSCTCAGGLNMLASGLAFIKLSRHVQMLEFYVIGAKVDPSFLTKWTLFLIFTWYSLESSLVDFTEVIKRFQLKLKSVSVINSQLFWCTNYFVMWRCNRIASTCDFSYLAALSHFLLQQSPFSFL